MRRRVRSLGAVLCCAVGAALVTSAPAVASPAETEDLCASLRLVVAPELESAWAHAAASLGQQLGDALSSAECAHVEVSLSLPAPPALAGSADVHVRTPDGREATRHVKTPAALLPIVVGLLASAPPEPSPPAHAAPPGLDRHELPDFTPPVRRVPEAPDPNHVGVFVGFAIGARAGLPTQVVMADVELFAHVVLHDWLILASVRYAPIAAIRGLTADGDAYEEAGIGLGIGRRFHLERSSLDLSFVPTLVLVSMETDLPVEAFGTLADLRLDACARYGYSLSRSWTFNVALDTDVSPNGLVRPQLPNPGLVPVPAWTVGLRFGMTAAIF
jgi:hypothetical protein